MRVQRRLAASLPLSALLLGCALAWPVCAQPRAFSHKGVGLRSTGAPAGAVRIAPPDLPANVDIDPSDLEPGDGAHSALSRIVADPGSILQAYAPVGRARAAAPSARRETISVRPAALRPMEPEGVAPPEGPGTASSVTLASVPQVAPAAPPVAPELKPSAPALDVPPPTSVPVAATVGQTPPASAREFASPNPPPPAAAPPPQAGSASRSPDPTGAIPAVAIPVPDATAQAPVTGGGIAILDAATLQKALDAYVGAEPVSVGGRVQPQEQSRFEARQALRAVYAARDFAPLWIEDGRFNARGRSILARIDHAAEDGLDLRATGVLVPSGGDSAVLGKAELSLTEAAVAYANQATGGRVDPSRLGPLVAMKPEVADPARVITTLIDAADAGNALHDFNPPHKGYALLRDKLAELRRSSDLSAGARIPYGPILKPGMRDARVPLIRARFGLDVASADAPDTNLVYDTRVAAAVAGFQKIHHLPASGVLTIRTVAVLSGGNPKRLEDEIIANMERWRWLPRDMGQNHIEVNIPDFTVKVMHGDTVFHHARVVVGQPDKPTPVFSETMEFIIVNPYWNVPLSIVKKEMLPKLAADPNYFANHGYETVERGGQTYVRQPPGDGNALGRIKFMFPNKYAVYLHDTNSRSLFGNDRRALSHGCVRVEAPFKFAEAVLGRDNGWTEARVKRLVGGDERTITLPHPLPIHIVYFTAFVDGDGVLQVRDDVYGYSSKLKTALGIGPSATFGQIAGN